MDVPAFVTQWSDVEKNITDVKEIFLPEGECPICLDTLSRLTDLCVLKCGHVVCNRCQKSLSECPSCRSKFDSKSLTIFNRDPMIVNKDLALIPVADLLCYKVVGVLVKPNANAVAKIESETPFHEGGIISYRCRLNLTEVWFMLSKVDQE
jgi:hypothetical protein